MRTPAELSGPIIAAGHACLDISPAFAPGSALPVPGELVTVGEANISTGGAAPNVGMALHRLGARTRLLALVGNDLLGQALGEKLHTSGAEIRLGVREGASTSYTIVLDPPGVDRGFLHCPGVNNAFDPQRDISDEDLQGGVALHFGYPPAMQKTFLDGGVSLASMFKRCRGMVTSLDLCFPSAAVCRQIDWRDWFAAVLPQVSMFCPSIEELRALLLLPPRDDAEDVPKLARMLLDMGAGLVCIKLGSRGIYLKRGNEEVWQGCLPARFVSANGAGDSTIAGLIVAQLCGYSLADSARLACCVGAFSVESPTATGGIPPWERVLARSADVPHRL